MVEGGADNPTACELACLPRPTVRDAGPLFERILQELWVPELDAVLAQRTVAEDIARRIVAGTVAPRDGFEETQALEEASEQRLPFWRSERDCYYYDGWAGDSDENAVRYTEFDNAVLRAARQMLARLSQEAAHP